MKKRNREWLDEEEPQPDKLESHFFYTYYSAMVHLSSAAIALGGLCSIDLADKRRWLFAMQSFTSSSLSVFSALDMIVHLDYVKACAGDAKAKLDPASWDRTDHFKSLSKLDYGDATRTIKEPLLVCGEPFKVLELRRWFRDRSVHRHFHYVTETQKAQAETCASPWCLFRPNMSTKEINNTRDKVNQKVPGVFNWDGIADENFIHTSDGGSGVLRVPAESLIRALIVRAAESLVAV